MKWPQKARFLNTYMQENFQFYETKVYECYYSGTSVNAWFIEHYMDGLFVPVHSIECKKKRFLCEITMSPKPNKDLKPGIIMFLDINDNLLIHRK